MKQKPDAAPMFRSPPMASVCLVALFVLAAGCVAPDGEVERGSSTPDPTPSSMPSPAPNGTSTPTSSPTATPTATPTSSATPTGGPTSSPNATPTPPPGTTHAVDIGRTVKGPAAEYDPDPVTIKAGDRIVWTNRDATVPHTATRIGSGAFDTGTLNNGASSAAILFETPGTYSYFCKFHANMAGEVVVEA